MSELGKIYEDGEIIILEGEVGNCMFEILDGEVEVLQKMSHRIRELDRELVKLKAV